MFSFFKVIHSSSWWLCPCGFKPCFPGDWWGWESLHAYSLTICVSSLVRCLLNIFAHFKNWVVVLLLLNFDNSLYILVKVFYQVCDFQIFSLVYHVNFVFTVLKSSRFFWWSPAYRFLMEHAFGIFPKKSLLRLRPQKFSSRIFFWNIWNSRLTFRCMIHFEWVFLWCMAGSTLYLMCFCCNCSNAGHMCRLDWRLSFPWDHLGHAAER